MGTRKPLTIHDFARLGGLARARKLQQAQVRRWEPRWAARGRERRRAAEEASECQVARRAFSRSRLGSAAIDAEDVRSALSTTRMGAEKRLPHQETAARAILENPEQARPRRQSVEASAYELHVDTNIVGNLAPELALEDLPQDGNYVATPIQLAESVRHLAPTHL